MPLAVCSALRGTDSSGSFDLAGISIPPPLWYLTACCNSIILMVFLVSSEMNLHLPTRVLISGTEGMDAFIWQLAEVRKDFIKVMPKVNILFDV